MEVVLYSSVVVPTVFGLYPGAFPTIFKSDTIALSVLNKYNTEK